MKNSGKGLLNAGARLAVMVILLMPAFSVAVRCQSNRYLIVGRVVNSRNQLVQFPEVYLLPNVYQGGFDSHVEAVPTGYMYKNGQVIGAKIDVTHGVHVRSQDLVVSVGHEGSHIANRQEAVTAWVTTGDYNQASSGALNITHYATETRAYGVSAAIAQYQGRDDLSFRSQEKTFTIWTKGMQNVDATVLNGLLANPPYNLSPGAGKQGDRLLPK